ncbi:TetR/AcrR family transcriptional regulator [Geodermatophilus sp. SYSU D00758]
MSGATGGGQRAVFLEGAVRHVLQHGVATLSLRPLARALGTSDRMLLYYFGTREQLLVAVLDVVGEQLRSGLAARLPERPVPPAALVADADRVLRDPAAEAHLRLYLEVSGLAARGQEPFAAVAAAVAGAWRSWLAERVDVPAGEREAAAAGVLAVLDGLLLLRSLGAPEAAAQAAGWLTDRLG